MGGYTVADTIYDQTHTWQNMNDRVAYQRVLGEEDHPVARRIATALLTANPMTANVEIQVNMNRPLVPARQGYNVDELSIFDVLDVDRTSHDDDRPPTDFSGSNGSWEGTSMPAVVW